MTTAKLLFNPELNTPSGNHLLSFPRPVLRAPKKGVRTAGADAEELTSTWIRGGINDLSLEEIEFIKSKPSNEERFRTGALEIIEPDLEDGQTATDTLADYKPAKAKKIVYNTFDLDWLRRSQAVDQRPDVQRWIKDRITNLEKNGANGNSSSNKNYGA